MIKYPTKKPNYQAESISAKNRGMTFEALIDETNLFYLHQNKAVIYKKPTPIQIVRVDYPKRSSAKIVEAYYKTPSTTDYNGVYQSYYIDFDVKETRNKASFPVKNIHEHQIEHLKNVHAHQGIAFILIFFTVHNKIFLLAGPGLTFLFARAKKGRKSIQYEECMKYGIEIAMSYRPTIPYLEAIDKLIQKNKSLKK